MVQGNQILSAIGIPQAGGPVGTGSSYPTSIGTEGHGQDPTLVTTQNSKLLPILGVPNAGSVVVACGGHTASIGTEGHIHDIRLMAAQYS